MRKIIILGSTGSIGTQALEIVRQYKDKLCVVGLCCDKNVDLLQKQIDEFKPEFVAVKDVKASEKLINDGRYTLFAGEDAPSRLAQIKCDLLLNSLVGISGLEPTVTAINAGSDIALANKETLVAGGNLVMALAKEKNVKILPVDSEHSAIWQCIDRDCNNAKHVNSIILTASGGAFRGKTRSELLDVNINDALKHPTWNMGLKVTVDSATMMNKGFEVIEAMHLFNVKAENIQVVVHRQSVVHSMVSYSDGSIIAQLSYPDMRLPIQLALLYPQRGDYCFKPLSFDKLSLDFELPDLETFECLAIAIDCAKKGGIYTTILNAANEIAVAYFAKSLIKFYDIPYYIKQAIAEFSQKGNANCDDLKSIIKLDSDVKTYVKELIDNKL